MDLKKKNILLILALFNFGCATKFFVPGNRFINAESSGDLWKGEFVLGGAGVTQVQVADDPTAVAPNTTPVLIKNSSTVLGIQMGVAKKVDLYYSSVSSAPTMAGVKVQLIGEPATSAKAKNFSLGLAGSIAFGNSDTSTDSSGNTGKSTIKFSGYETMLLTSYRISDGFLIYLNPFMSKTDADIKIERTSGSVTTTTAEPDGNGEMKGIALGARFGKSFFLNTEISMTEMNWTRTNPSELQGNKFTDNALGIVLGGTW